MLSKEREEEIRNYFTQVKPSAHNAGAVQELLAEIDRLREENIRLITMHLERTVKETEKHVAQIRESRKVSRELVNLEFDI